MANFDFNSYIERLSRIISFGNQKTNENIEKMAGSVSSGIKTNSSHISTFRQEAQKNTQSLSSIISTLYSRLEGVKKSNDSINENIIQNNYNNKEIISNLSNLNASMNSLIATNNNIINQLRNLNSITTSGNRDFLGFFSFFKKGMGPLGTLGGLSTLGKVGAVTAGLNNLNIRGDLGAATREIHSLGNKQPGEIGFPGGGKLPEVSPPSSETGATGNPIDASKQTTFTGSKQEAFDKIENAARAAGSPDPKLTAALAMHESGWLKSRISQGNNPFGQTITRAQIGKNGIIDGTVGADGQLHAVYDSLESAIKHHISKWGKNYVANDPQKTLSNLVASKYNVTDPSWSSNILSIYKGSGKTTPSGSFATEQIPGATQVPSGGGQTPGVGDTSNNAPGTQSTGQTPDATQVPSGGGQTPSSGQVSSGSGTPNATLASYGNNQGNNNNSSNAVKIASTMINATRKESLDYLAKGGFINKGEAWCAQFVNSTLKQAGMTGTGSAVANSFQNWGNSIKPQEVKAGDVVLLTRGKGPNQVGGHVGIATGNVQNGQIEMIAGNTSGKVKKYFVPIDSKIMIRRSSDGKGTDQSQPTGTQSAEIPGTTGGGKELTSQSPGGAKVGSTGNIIDGILGMIPGGNMISGLLNTFLGGSGGIGGLINSFLGSNTSQNIPTSDKSQSSPTTPTASLSEPKNNIGNTLNQVALQNTVDSQQTSSIPNQNPTQQANYDQTTPYADNNSLQDFFSGGPYANWNIGNMVADSRFSKKSYDYFQI